MLARSSFLNRIIIKNAEQIEGIRKSSRLAAHALDHISSYIQAGVTTAYLDQIIDSFIRQHSAIPATLNYKGFPKSCCISPNEIVCHGIPSENTILRNGDILNVDITTILQGYYGDTSRMFSVGMVSDEAKHIMNVAGECLRIGIDQCYPDNFFGNIGYHIHEYASSQNCHVVTDYCGHGVGLRFHEEPQVAHKALRNSGKRMKPGMIFTVEPMINLGTSRTTLDRQDGWTVRTADKKLSAQYEHTILITNDGHDVLTDIHAAFQAISQ
jgi:methionyl aminopeptidase